MPWKRLNSEGDVHDVRSMNLEPAERPKAVFDAFFPELPKGKKSNSHEYDWMIVSWKSIQFVLFHERFFKCLCVIARSV